MKRARILVACLTLSLGLFAATSAQAQQGAVGPVAIIDLAYIFKNHPKLQAMTEDLKRQIEAADVQLKASRDELQNMAAQLELYKKGTPEHKQLEEEIAKRQAALSLQVNTQRRDFLEQEARNHFGVYQEVLAQVRYYCESVGISLVLRFNGDEVDQADPQDVYRGLSNLVVYSHQHVDITPIILTQIRQASVQGVVPMAAQPQRTPVGVPPRQ